MNKKSLNLILEQTIFIILVIMWAMILLSVLYRVEHNTGLYEQLYAKEIALLLDRAEPGMEIQLDLTRAYNLATTNKFNGEIVRIDPAQNAVVVKLTDGKGYSYHFFTDAVVTWSADKSTRKLSLTFYKKEARIGEGAHG